MDQGIDDVLEHHAVGDPASMAAQRVIWVEFGAIPADHGVEFDPDGFQ
ncbi:hypothetical protein FHR32_002731 [Streptosporangium album]|uniref:Uncharacterized protein n=1 Tax=Streptosporangium album TaxID=47479 RepID=A0A7W7RW19_9ACTN|nr:hypothetical protein [Streptosporangium album]